MFGTMLEQVKHDTISILSRIRIQGEDDLAEMARRRQAAEAMKFQHAEASALRADADAAGGRRRTDCARGPAVRSRRPQGRSQRAVPLWLRQEIQAVSRQAELPRPDPMNHFDVAAGILLRFGRSGPDRRATRWRSVSRSVGISRRQDSGRANPHDEALSRELAEELGIEVTACSSFMNLRHEYDDRIVTYRVLYRQRMEQRTGRPGRAGVALGATKTS